jgi:hypothetical protein
MTVAHRAFLDGAADPTMKELLERIKKIDAIVSIMAAEVAQQRKDIDELSRFVDREFANASTAVRNHDMRMCSVEQKVFPALWPTIERAESIIGRIDDPFQQNALDRRVEKS